MKNFLRNNSHSRLFRFWFVVIVLGVLSLIPIIQTYGKLTIGGDTFVPPIPENAYHMVYEWLDRNNGDYTSNNYVIWLSLYYLLTRVGLTIYQAAFTIQFLIFFLSAIGIYKIYNLFNKSNALYGLIPAIFFIYSPHLLDHMAYYQSTIAIVWVTYFLMKFIRNKTFPLSDVIVCSLLLGIISDLPNPKYHFLLFVLFVLTIGIAMLMRTLRLRDLKANLSSFICLTLMTTYLFMPFLYFGYSFSHTNQAHINVKKGYQVVGETLDYGVATVGKMMRLFHTPNLNQNTYDLISNPFFSLGYYSVAIAVLALFPLLIPVLEKEHKKKFILIYVLALFFIFLSKSSNPPFGFFYEWVLNSSQLFAFMRTTAGIVIYAAIFYAIIYGLVTQYLSVRLQKYTFVILCSIIIITIIGFPYWSGRFFLNRSVVNIYTNLREHGVRIPKDYISTAAFIKNLKLDSKIAIYPKAMDYQNNTWGYFGFIMYPWIYPKPTVAYGKVTEQTRALSSTNTLYAIHDKSLVIDQDHPWATPEGTLLFQTKMVDVYRTPEEMFTPHMSIPSRILIANTINSQLLQQKETEHLAIYKPDTPTDLLAQLPERIEQKPIIEYKKINPTKYRVRIHYLKDTIPLIFSENYHPEWKVYVNRYTPEPLTDQRKTIDAVYQVSSQNTLDQATTREVKQFISDGVVSTSNKGGEFISKNFRGTIQNDNLPNGSLFETFFKKPLDNNMHIQVNEFANSWVINPSTVCKQAFCIQNHDGSYDVELIIEFWPQRLSYIGYIISFVTMLGCISYLIFKKLFWHSRKDSL